MQVKVAKRVFVVTETDPLTATIAERLGREGVSALKRWMYVHRIT